MINIPVKSLRHSLVLFTLIIGGCASVGKNFSYHQYQSLEIGKTSSEDYRAIFGNPLIVTTEDTDDEKVEVANYVYASANLGSARSRALILEFKDGLLNSYMYASSFEEEKPILDIAALEKIERGVTSREDAVRTLGEPYGKAKCPSKAPSFKDRCESVEDVYAWSLVEKLSTFGVAFGGSRPQSQSVFLGFNSSGKVESVQKVAVGN